MILSVVVTVNFEGSCLSIGQVIIVCVSTDVRTRLATLAYDVDAGDEGLFVVLYRRRASG